MIKKLNVFGGEMIVLFVCLAVFLGAVLVGTSASSQDATYQAKVYHERGGDRVVVQSGGEIDVTSGGIMNVVDCYKIDDESELCSVDVTITTAQLLALNNVAVQVVASVAGKFIVPLGVQSFLDYNSIAYSGIAANENLLLCYTSSAGVEFMEIETTGFLDQTTDQTRYSWPSSSGDIALVGSADVVLHLDNGEIAAGNSPLKMRIYYKLLAGSL